MTCSAGGSGPPRIARVDVTPVGSSSSGSSASSGSAARKPATAVRIASPSALASPVSDSTCLACRWPRISRTAR